MKTMYAISKVNNTMKQLVSLILFIVFFLTVGLAIIPQYFTRQTLAKSVAKSCFPAGTKITMADYTTKNIEDVKAGDQVVSQSVAGTRSISTVASVETPIRDHMCQINFADGGSVKLTNEHPLLTTTGWKAIKPQQDAYQDPNLAVGTFARGDRVIQLDKSPGIVKSISCWPEKVQTYNLLLNGGAHTYFADGYLAHNKWSPTASFNKAERAALLNGVTDPTTGQVVNINNAGVSFSTIYVQTLRLEGKIVDTSLTGTYGTQLTALRDSIQARIDAYAQKYGLDANSGGTGGITADQLTDLIVSGKGLSESDLRILQGNLQQASNVGGSVAGYYKLVDLNGDALYYLIGTGPKGGSANSGDVIVITPIPPPGTIQARAVTMATIPLTCDDIHFATATTTFRNGTQFDMRLAGVSQGVQTQSGSTYVSWSLEPNTFQLVPLSAGNSSVRACLNDGTGDHFGTLSVALASSVTDTFDVAYGPPPAWFQTQGGDVYAAGSITSLTPSTAISRLFNLDGGGGYPGIVTYGNATDYDFANDMGNQGEAFVSSKNWLVNDQYSGRDFYNYFYSKLGSPTTPDFDSLTDPLPQPATPSASGVYYVKGDMTTTGNWVIGDDQKYIFLVDGSVTIGTNPGDTITISGPKGNGFIAFIAKNNINISPNVGGAFDSVTPDVEGVYIANTLHTGTSTVVGAERFVGRGIFVANDVELERNLKSIDQNTNYAAELFIYNPALLIELPDVFKNVPVSWQEVAP